MDCSCKSWRLTATALNLVSGSVYPHEECIAKVPPLHLRFNVFIGAEMTLHFPAYLAVTSAVVLDVITLSACARRLASQLK